MRSRRSDHLLENFGNNFFRNIFLAGIASRIDNAASIISGVSRFAVQAGRSYICAMDPRDKRIDKWPRSHSSPSLNSPCATACVADFAPASTMRIDELFAEIIPTEDEFAAILKHSCEIGEAMAKELGD
jgi:hypothetical protein